jgi:hypothetical protein
VRFCLRAHHQQAQTVEFRVAITAALWSGLEEELERRQLPDRMMYALYPRRPWTSHSKFGEKLGG